MINYYKDTIFDLSEKTTIITGAARGLGRAIAKAIAEAGSNIIIADKDFKIAKKTEKEIKKIGTKVISLQMDVTNMNEVLNMIKIVNDNFGKIDVLINNAGVCKHINSENYNYPQKLDRK